MNQENLTDEERRRAELALIDENYIDERDLRRMLISEIRFMKKEIIRLRSKLGGKYSKAYIAMMGIMESLQGRPPERDNTEPIQMSYTAKLMFYAKFMKMYMTEDRKYITLLSCGSGRQTFGFDFKKNLVLGFYQLYRSCLPYSLNVEEEMNMEKFQTEKQTVEYVKTVLANIHAYQMRLDQVKCLQMKLNRKHADLFHNIGYTHMELQFDVKIQDREYLAIMKLNYGPLEIRPGDMHVVSPDNSIPNEYLELLSNKLKPVRELSLPEFYDTIFHAKLPLTLS